MAYIFKKKDEVVEYLTQLEFTIGDEYNHYIVPHHAYTTRFDIFYNSENVGYVENEELTPNANSEWVIHIPTDKRAYLESKNKGLVGAIFDLPTNQDGTIDKKYYIEPVAFTRIIGKDYNNTPHQIDAKGPGAYVGLKFDNEFWDIEDTEIAQGTKQLNIRIDLKRFANILKYSLAEISGAMPSGVVTDPQGISIRTCNRFPSIIVAEDNNSRPVWKDLKDITVGYAEKATNTDRFGMKTPEEFVTYENINTDITSYFDNSYEYGFRTGYDLEKNQSYVYTRAYKVHLVGDVSGDAEIHNFEDIDIECTLRDRQSYIDSLKPCPIELMGGVLDDRLVANKGIIIPIDGGHVFGDQYGSLVPLTIGDYTKIHLEFDNNEIMAKMDESRPAGVGQNASGEALFLQPEGGLVNIGGRARTNLHVNGNISTMNVEEDPGNYEPSGGNLLIVGTSDLRGNTTIGKNNRPANLTVYGDTNLNGLNITKDGNGDIIFDIPANKKYKFNINGSTAYTIEPEMEDFISSLANPESGIVYDPEIKKLKVDFSKIPKDTSEFDDLIQSLDMQVPLRANKAVYVDCNTGEDTLIDEYGKKIDRGSENLPFKTIKACIKYITSNYALGEYNISVYIAPGTYTEKVTLPNFDSTSGYILLRAKDYNNPPVITNDTYNGYTVNMLGGTWRLVRLDIRMNAGIPRKSGGNLVGSELTEADLNMTAGQDAQAIHISGGTCRIYGCNIQTEFNEADPVPPRTMWVECIRIEGNSTLYFGTLLNNDIFYPNILTCIKNNVSSAKIMFINSKSTVYLLTYNNHITDAQKETIYGNNVETIFFNGDVHTALHIAGGSTFDCGNGGNHQQLIGGNLVGRKYYVAGASSMIIRNLPNHEGEEIDGLESGIPGTIKGVIKPEEFAWKRIL